MKKDFETIPATAGVTATTGDRGAEKVEGKHTPGPWRAWPPEEGERSKWQIDAPSGPLLPEKKIATVHSGALHNSDRSEANARLIAAAPDLLHALETLMVAAEIDGWPPGWGLVTDRARAAIAKAKDRS